MNFLNGAMYSINAAALLIGAAGLLSRLLGVVRDRLLASEFGASRELDIYYAAFQIPDFLYTLFLLGAAAAAVIPVLAEVRARSEEDALRFLKDLLALVSVASAALSVAAFFAMPYLVGLIAPGFSLDERTALVSVSRILLLSPIFLAVSSVLSSAIQSARLFGVYALTGIVYNAGIIAGILFLAPRFGLPGLAAGVVAGAALHAAVQIAPVRRLGFRMPSLRDVFVLIRRRALSENVRRVIALSVPRAVALSFRQLTFLMFVAIASTLLSGSISILQFAYNLQYIPVGIFGLSFAVAAFPRLCDSWASRNADHWARAVAGSARAILFWVVPVSVLFYVLRAQIVRVALGGGKFDWSDTILTAAVFGVFSVSIFAESLIPLCTRALYSIGDTKTPLRVAVFAAVLSVGSALGLVAFLHSGPDAFLDFFRHLLKVGNEEGIAVVGISWAFVVGGVAQAAALFWALRRSAAARFGEAVALPVPWNDIVRIVWVSLAAGIVAFGTLRTVNLAVSLETFGGVLAQGASAFAAGAVVYAAALYLLGNEEVNELVEAARQRLFRREVLPRELDGERVDEPR